MGAGSPVVVLFFLLTSVLWQGSPLQLLESTIASWARNSLRALFFLFDP